MTTISFDLLWRDRGVAKGLKSLGEQAEKTKARFEKLASTDAVGAKFGERFRQGFAKNTAKLPSVVTDKLAATAAGGKIVAAGAKVGDRFSFGFLKPAQRIGEQVSQRLTAISSSRFVSAGSTLGTHFHSGFAKATAKMSESISRAASRGGGSSGGARGFVSMGARLGGNFRAGFIKPIGGLPGIIAGLVGGAVIMGAKRLATEASDMNETVSKTRTIFGGSSKAIESWAKGAAKNLGMSRQQALDGASAFGNLFDQLGFGVGQSAKMSKGFAQMATDAASFNNANPAEVMDAFLSATRGEYDALQRYIPTVNAAAIETYALSSGIVKATKDTGKIELAQQRAAIAQSNYNAAVKEHGRGSIEARRAQVTLASAQQVVSKAMKGSVGELTAAQKAQALYELSTKDLGAAHGDFAKTAGGFANQQRIMAANWADLRVKIGTYFLPMFTKAAKYMNTEGFAALTRIVDVLGTVGRSAGAMARAVTKSLSGAFGPAVDAATVNLTELADWFETHQAGMIRFFIGIGDAAFGLGRGLARFVSGTIRGFGTLTGGLADMLDNMAPFAVKVLDTVIAIENALGHDTAALRAARDNMGPMLAETANGLRNARTKANETADAFDRKVFPALTRAQGAMHRVGETEIWKAKQRDAANRASIAIRDIGLKADGSQIKLKTWNERTRLGSVEQQRLEGRIKAARQRMIEQRTTAILAGDTQGGLTRRWNQGREALFKQFRQMGLSKEEARQLSIRYSKVPKHLEVKHTTPGSKAARQEMEDLRHKIAVLKSKGIAVNVGIKFSPDKLAKSLIKGDYFNNPGAFQPVKAGGPIQNLSGRGRPGVDTEPVLAAAGEHVWTNREVDAVGGHDRMYQIRAAALRGDLKGYVQGGEVSRYVRVRNQVRGSANLTGMVNELFHQAGHAGVKYGEKVGLAWAIAAKKKAAEVAAATGGTATTPGRYGDTRFNAAQLRNAAAIVSVGNSLGVGRRGNLIALMTAMQESTLRNLSYGDRDSVGLFQQRGPWGSFAARTNPRQAARMFFTGGAGGQRGLLDIPGWRRLGLGQAAQRVQVSAFPGAYSKWADEASAILSGGGGVSGFVGAPGNPRGLTSFRGGRFTRLAVAHLRRVEQISGQTLRIMQGGWRPRSSFSGTSHAGDASDTQRSAAVIRAFRSVGWASGDRTGLGNWGPHAHSIPGPGRGYAGGSARWQWGDYVRRGGSRQGLRSPWGLERGGLLTARVAERGPERLLSAPVTRTFERMVRVMERGGSAGGTHVTINMSAPNYVGSQQDLADTMVKMGKRGQLDVVWRSAGVKV